MSEQKKHMSLSEGCELARDILLTAERRREEAAEREAAPFLYEQKTVELLVDALTLHQLVDAEVEQYGWTNVANCLLRAFREKRDAALAHARGEQP
jgi:hypothetical protein